MHRLFPAAALAICLSGTSVFAAPDEIQVYTEETNDPGQFGLEEHINYTIEGGADAGVSGADAAAPCHADHP